MKNANTIECCNTCKHLLAFSRGNSYGDINYLCPITTYYVTNIKADVHKYKRYSPGGKELICRYSPKVKTEN